MQEIATVEKVDLSAMTLFYYEVYEFEFDQELKFWSAISDPKPCNVVMPKHKILVGYDVATFLAHTTPECSPLSCNYLCEELVVNEHCLLATFDEAKTALDDGKFANSEPGPCRIFAIYTAG